MHPGGESVLLARRMAAGIVWMTADARADACGHAADERERIGGTALERRLRLGPDGKNAIRGQPDSGLRAIW